MSNLPGGSRGHVDLFGGEERHRQEVMEKLDQIIDLLEEMLQRMPRTEGAGGGAGGAARFGEEA